MQSKGRHKKYMQEWRKKRKLADMAKNPPLNGLSRASLGSQSPKPSKTINENCDTFISPEKKVFNMYMFHPVRKKRIYLSECSGKTLFFFKNLGYEIE